MGDTLGDSATVPMHVGLILDGNRRWARARGLADREGHEKGFNVFSDFAPLLFERGVKFVSAYVFSTENWKRAEEEVSFLMNLFIKIAKTKLKELGDKNIRVKFLGRKDRLNKILIEAMDEVEAATAAAVGGTLGLCLNYGGTFEIVDAVKKAAKDEEITELTNETLAKYLYAPEFPPVDIIVRTGGQHRISNFMLWRSAYAELLFLDKYWPDITKEDIDVILKDYAERTRRYGK